MTDDTMSQVAVVVLLLVLSIPALATAHAMSGTPFEYEESMTVDYTTPSSVSENGTEAEGYGSDPTIVVAGTTLERETDYRWNSSNGTVTWIDSANTTSGDTAEIQYRAYQRTEESALAWQISAPLMSFFGLYGLVISVRALLTEIGEVW